ncbi:MAG: hypothetical protein ACO3EZ_01095 [Prochlorotrichaceae cyanobacterium]
MARYTCSFTVALTMQNLHQCLVDLFTECKFDVIYDTSDYVMAREIPGGVPFAKLVTAEALIDKTFPDRESVRINLVIKNEELPLQTNNHCYRMFDTVKKAIADHYNWQLVDLVSS